MSRSQRLAAVVLLVLLGIPSLVNCEKGRRLAAQREFHELISRRLPPEEQATALEAFVERYPDPKTNTSLIQACRLLAAYHSREHRNGIAAVWHERALAADPDDPNLMNSLGYHYAQNGMQLDRAVELLKEAVRLAEERELPTRRQGMIRDSLGWAYRMRGDLAPAVTTLEKACEMAPGSPILREHLADAYRAAGDPEKSAAIYIDLYIESRATDLRLRRILSEIESDNDDHHLDIEGRIDHGLQLLADADRRVAAAEGAELVELTAEDGHRLQASLYRPGDEPDGASPTPRGAVLLLHAVGSNRRAASSQARALAARGLVCLTLDLRGHGGSVSEEVPNAQEFSASLEENMEGAALDARAALEYLDRHPRVDRRRIGLVGAGAGALLATELAGSAAEREAIGLVMLSPWGEADAYRPFIQQFDAKDVLVVTGESESRSAETIFRLARGWEPGDGGAIVAPVSGSGYELLAADSDLGERVLSFLQNRLR